MVYEALSQRIYGVLFLSIATAYRLPNSFEACRRPARSIDRLLNDHIVWEDLETDRQVEDRVTETYW